MHPCTHTHTHTRLPHPRTSSESPPDIHTNTWGHVTPTHPSSKETLRGKAECSAQMSRPDGQDSCKSVGLQGQPQAGPQSPLLLSDCKLPRVLFLSGQATGLRPRGRAAAGTQQGLRCFPWLSGLSPSKCVVHRCPDRQLS